MAAPALDRLPTELVLQIASHITCRDKVKVSTTCRRLHQCLVESTFKAIRFTNRKRHRLAICDVVQRYGQFAEALTYRCYLYRDPEDGAPLNHYTASPTREPDERDGDLIAAETNAIDAHLLCDKGLPGLAALCVRFVSTPTPLYWPCRYPRPDTNDVQRRKHAEMYESRVNRGCAASLRLWANLKRNQSLRHLRLEELGPDVTLHKDLEWMQFVARLESLTLCLAGSKEIPDETYYLEHYRQFQKSIGTNWLQGLLSLKTLSIEAALATPYGGTTREYAAFDLQAHRLPRLSTLSLTNCVLDGLLEGFLIAKADTLRTLQMFDCYALDDRLGGQPDMEWGIFFSNIRESRPALSELVVSNVYVDITYTEAYAHRNARHGFSWDAPSPGMPQPYYQDQRRARLFVQTLSTLILTPTQKKRRRSAGLFRTSVQRSAAGRGGCSHTASTNTGRVDHATTGTRISTPT